MLTRNVIVVPYIVALLFASGNGSSGSGGFESIAIIKSSNCMMDTAAVRPRNEHQPVLENNAWRVSF